MKIINTRIPIIVVLLVGLFAVQPAMAGCIKHIKKPQGYKLDCLSEDHRIWDMDTQSIVELYIHYGRGYGKSYIKKAYKKQGLKATKVNLKHAKSYKFQGLRSKTGKILLPTIYKKVTVFSNKYALVTLLNDLTYIVDIKTGKFLYYPPGELKDARLSRVIQRKSSDINLVFVKTKDYGKNIVDFKVLNSDLTLGPVIKYVYGSGRTYDIQVKGFNVLATTKNPKTGERGSIKADFRSKTMTPIKSIVGIFDVRSTNGINSKNKVNRSVMMSVGESPKGIGNVGDLLYWPVDKNGDVLPKPDNISGMLPFGYSDIFHSYVGWLIVYKSEKGFDYKIANSSDDNSAKDLVQNLNKFLLLDDVRLLRDDEISQFYHEGLHSWSVAYAYKIKHGKYAGKWYATVNRNHDDRGFFAVIYGPSYYPNFKDEGSLSFEAAIVTNMKYKIAKYNEFLDGFNRYAENKKNKQREDQIKVSQFTNNYRTASTDNCESLPSYLKEKNSQSAKAWTGLYKSVGSMACNYVPVDLLAGYHLFMSGPDVTAKQALDQAVYKRVKQISETYWRCDNNYDGTQTCYWSKR